MDKRQKRMIGHGAIVMLFGLLGGLGLGIILIGGFEIFPGYIFPIDLPSDSAAWARVHAGGLMNGLMVIIFALVIHAARIPERLARHLFWMIVGAGYANTIFYWGALLAPSRALTFGDNPLGETNVAGIIGLLPAFFFAFITIAAVVMLAAHIFGRGVK